MFKKLLPFVLLCLLVSQLLYSQNLDILEFEAIEVSHTGHICTLDPTDENANIHIAPSPEFQRKIQHAASTMFEIDYAIEANNSCGDQNWPSDAAEAFEYTLGIWATHLHSDIPIRVQAVWRELEGVTLGSAGPTRIIRLNSIDPNSWYSIAQLTAMSGRALREEVDTGNGTPLQHDIRVNVNCSVSDWYFGTDARTPQGRLDFVTVVLHELAHGFGFFGSMNVPENSQSGSWGGSGSTVFPYIYDRFAYDGNFIQLINQTQYSNPSGDLFLALTGQRDGVFFDGDDALLTLEDQPQNRARLYTPHVWNSGSSYSHLDEATFSRTINALMVPRMARALAIHSPGPLLCGMFSDMGWPLAEGCLTFLAADAVIAISDNNIDFGVINEGETRTKMLQIRSDAASVETLAGTLELNSDHFVISGSNSFSLQPGQSVEIEITYQPQSTDLHTTSMLLFHNAKNIQPPVSISLIGETLRQNQVLHLEQSYPNPIVPTNPNPRIPYSIAITSDVKLDLFSINGQHIRTLYDGVQSSGRYEIEVDITGMTTGLYIYRIIVNGESRSGKMMLFR
ncbi:MAG: T9SS C-terminal target domain-containing protein [Balneolaceae bacterium]|nr:MAG: T9SS C-terminal target domain-containing protein [Balneolaceae bacterium]